MSAEYKYNRMPKAVQVRKKSEKISSSTKTTPCCRIASETYKII
jgi:hypothetical protein